METDNTITLNAAIAKIKRLDARIEALEATEVAYRNNDKSVCDLVAVKENPAYANILAGAIAGINAHIKRD